MTEDQVRSELASIKALLGVIQKQLTEEQQRHQLHADRIGDLRERVIVLESTTHGMRSLPSEVADNKTHGAVTDAIERTWRQADARMESLLNSYMKRLQGVLALAGTFVGLGAWAILTFGAN